jgi:hypothetical protein
MGRGHCAKQTPGTVGTALCPPLLRGGSFATPEGNAARMPCGRRCGGGERSDGFAGSSRCLRLGEILSFSVRNVGWKAMSTEIGLGCLEGKLASQGFKERFLIGPGREKFAWNLFRID